MSPNLPTLDSCQANIIYPVTESGTVFIVTDTEDATYVIYALETVTLRASPDAITADVAYNNVIRLAKVSQESHRVLLDQYHSAYPTAAKLEYELGNTEGAIVFSWETVGSGELLMLTWPHHRGVMQNGNFPPTSALGYLTTKVGFAIELPSYWPTSNSCLHKLVGVDVPGSWKAMAPDV